jgi:hypothetical protein
MQQVFKRLAVQATGLALLAGGAFGATAMPAAAQSACDASPGNILVEFLGVGTSNTILAQGADGSYQGNVLVHVYCGLDGSPVTNAVVSIYSNVPGSAVYDPSTGTWNDATNPSSPVSINVPTGDQQIALRTDDPNLTGWKARVGADTVNVVQAFGQTVSGTDGYPVAQGGIWAQTPELDSLSLFGSGAAGLVGYLLLRRRARGGSKQD